MDDFFSFLNRLGFWVFLVHPTVVSVLLSASVERCFVSVCGVIFKWPHINKLITCTKSIVLLKFVAIFFNENITCFLGNFQSSNSARGKVRHF